MTVLAGNGTAAELDGTGTAAEFNGPVTLTTDGTYVYVVDDYGKTVRRVTISSGLVATIIPVSAGLIFLHGIVVVGTGSNAALYVTGTNDNLIRKIQNPESADVSKITASTFCGTGTDGVASGSCSGAAEFSAPYGITSDGTYLYVTDDNTYAIQQIDIANAQVEPTLAGAGTSSQAQLQSSSMTDLTTDGTSLYAVDNSNNVLIEIQ